MMTHSAVGDAGAVPSITRTAESARDDGNLARPVALDGCRTDDQTASAGREVPQRDDRLARLAQAHVVGEDRAPPAEQERDAFDLVREEPVGERDRAPERRVRIAGQLEQLCECRGLRVERVGHARGRILILARGQVRPPACKNQDLTPQRPDR